MINFLQGWSYIESLDWIENKKAIINPKSTNDRCFQYAATAALKFDEIKADPQGASNIIPFINKYDRHELKDLSKIDFRKTFEKINPVIALNVAYIKEIEKCPAYISKINSNCENEYMKSDKTPCITYVHLESLIKIKGNSKNNPDNIENNYSLHRRKDCMKKFCFFLREDLANVINFEKKKMSILTEKKA